MWSFYIVTLAFFSAIEPFLTASSPLMQKEGSKNEINTNCPRPFGGNHKSYYLKPLKESYAHSQFVIVSCADGSKKSHKCQNGLWKPSFDWVIECSNSETCPPIEKIDNGFITPPNSTFKPKSELHFTCEKGYELIGAPVILCDAGYKWTYKPPFCTKISPPTTEAGPRSRPYVLSLTILLSMLSIIMLLVIGFSAYQRRKRNKMQNQWRRYFNHYTYRASQRKITRRTGDQTNGTVHFTQVPAQITDL